MLDSLARILGITLMYAQGLIFTSMGGIMSENTGVVNIGLEGMMTLGAVVGATVGYYTGNPWIAFLSAGLAGMGMALLHAVATIHLHGDHVISGIGLNLIGPGLALFLSRIFFDGAAMTKPIPLESKMPRPLNGLFASNSIPDIVLNQYVTVYLAFILTVIVWFILYKTKLGLRMRAVGEHPRAAETLGINAYKIKYIGVLLSGLFAGFGGGVMSLAVASNYRITLISGQGFIALAAMIFGKWKPQGALMACLLFGFSQGLVVYLSSIDVGIPSMLISMLPYVITLVVLVFMKGSSGPSANGLVYKRNAE